MGLISFEYVIFVLIGLVCYYLAPKQTRWCVLLLASGFYYVYICKWYSLFILATIVSTYICAIAIYSMQQKQDEIVKAHKKEWSREERKAYKERGRKKRSAIMLAGIILNFGLLAFLKYIPLAAKLGLLLPLGISFYSFQSMGYLMDVYREKIEPQRNFFKLALFVSFFPQIIQGPISMYDQLADQLYEGHSFDYERTKKALMLVLWGVMKKIVVADRAVNILNFVMDNTGDFSGSYILLAALVYALQLYCDFSGGIDIVRGVGELFGITMPINFNHPYFSRSLTEYWHRWHMTLGDWCRNYIFYPLSISKTFLNFGKWLKPRFGKHIAKVLPGSIASVITFLVIGVWHGANTKYVIFGLWNGVVIMLAELFAPVNQKASGFLYEHTPLKKDGIISTCISVVWTFLLVLVGYYFDIAKNGGDAIQLLKKSVVDFHLGDWKLQAIIDTMKGSSLDYWDIRIIIVCTFALFVISLLQERCKRPLRDVILEMALPIRWIILFSGIFFVLIFGYYGPGSNPGDFVYMQF